MKYRKNKLNKKIKKMLGEILLDKEAKNSSPAATKNKQKTTISVDESNDSQFNSNKSKEFEKGGKKKVKITKCTNCKSLKQKIAELEQIIIDLNKIKDTLIKEKDELFSKNKELSTKNIELMSLNEQLEKINKDLDKDNSELTKENSKIKNENNQLKKQLDTKINDIKLLTSESFRQENIMKTEEELKTNSNGELSIENERDNRKKSTNNKNINTCNCKKAIDDILYRLKEVENWKDIQEKKEKFPINKSVNIENKIINIENNLSKLHDEFNDFSYDYNNKLKYLSRKISSRYSEQLKDKSIDQKGYDESENEKNDYRKIINKSSDNDYYDSEIKSRNKQNSNQKQNSIKRSNKKIYSIKDSINNSETEKLAKSHDNVNDKDDYYDDNNNNNYSNKINRRYIKNKEFSEKKIRSIRAKTPINNPSNSNSNHKYKEKQKRIKSVFNSKIITDTDDLDLIARGLVMDNIKKLRNLKIGYKLIYRATEDGDTAKNFHQNCDGIFGTLCIVKTRGGWIFGGYTALAWDSDEETEKKDLDSFVFSINLEKIYYATEKEDYSIYCDKNKGPCFIGMFSIEKNILDSKSFISPWNVQCYEGETLTGEINGGKMDFYVDELEVYQVIIKKTRD